MKHHIGERETCHIFIKRERHRGLITSTVWRADDHGGRGLINLVIIGDLHRCSAGIHNLILVTTLQRDCEICVLLNGTSGKSRHWKFELIFVCGNEQ